MQQTMDDLLADALGTLRADVAEALSALRAGEPDRAEELLAAALARSREQVGV